MLRISTAILILLMCGGVAFGQVFSDDFENGLGNWNIVNDGGDCDWVIMVPDYPNEYDMPKTSAEGLLVADSDECGIGTIVLSTAWTMSLDLSSATTVSLDFDSDWYTNGTQDTAQVVVVADGGEEMIVLEYAGVDARNEHVTLDLTAELAGASSALIGFRSIQPDWDWWWAIDNVVVSTDGGGGGDPGGPPHSLVATAGESTIDLEWQEPAPEPTDTTGIFYFEDPIDAQLGCSAAGVCELAVRFTPPSYPAWLVSVDVFQQGGPTTAMDMRIYTDPAGAVAGPPVPFVDSYASIGGTDGWHSVDLNEAILLGSGDFYVGGLEINGFMGMGNDLGNQDDHIDRNWASTDGGATFGTLFDLVGGDVTLYGNLGIIAYVATADGQIVPIIPNIADMKENLYNNQVVPRTANSVEFANAAKGSTYQAPDLSDAVAYKEWVKKHARKHNTTINSEFAASLLGYNVYRSDDGENYSLIASTGSETTNYTDSDVNLGVEYYYYVTADYDEGESEPSNVVSAIIVDCEPMELSHATSEFVAAVTNIGSVGDEDPNLSSDRLPGFQWPPGSGFNQLFEGGLMIGVSPDWVSDAARVISAGGQQAQDEDFLCITDVEVVQDDGDGQVYSALYNDENAGAAPLADDGPNTPIGIQVEQTTYTFNDEGNTGYLIYEVAVTNTSDEQLDGLLIGGYFDWDVGQALFSSNTGSVYFVDVEVGGQEFEMEFVESHVNNNDNHPYIGHVPLSQNIFQSSWVADNAEEVFPGGGSPLTEANKYGYMNERRESDPFGDPFGANDKSLVVGLGGIDGGYSVEPGGTVVAAFAIVGGADMDAFTTNGVAAMNRWVEMGNEVAVFDDLTPDPPTNLVATPGADGGYVDLTWDAPADCDDGGGGVTTLSEGFEGGALPDGWASVDSDGDGNNWLFDDVFVRTGTFSARSESFINGYGPITPDNWLISPAIEVGAGAGLSFWVGAVDPAWYFEHWEVWVSTTGSDPGDFTDQILDVTMETDVWTEHTADLSAYTGQTIHLAWVHNEITDVFSFSMDDIEVTGSSSAGWKNGFETPAERAEFTTASAVSPNHRKGDLEFQVEAKPVVQPEARIAELLGYNVFRSDDGTNFDQIASFECGDGTMYHDEVEDGTYWYYVTALYDNGESEPSNTEGPVVVTGIAYENVVPADYSLSQNYPNPFNPTTNIKYTLKENVNVSLKIFNTLGQEVKTLVNDNQIVGAYTVDWDATDNAGAKVASGVYIYRIEAGDFIQTRKMVLLK